MKTITLGSTGIVSPQNAFGALPVQRDDIKTAAAILRRAYEGGMTFFDTARAYSDSEEKIGLALSSVRDKITIATKTHALTPGGFRADLETSLRTLKTDYVEIYQFHQAEFCPRPGDGTGLYEEMLRAKAEGKIRHIGITTHRLKIANEAIDSGLYEIIQFPFSYLATKDDIAMINRCRENNIGVLAMKGLSGGLLTNAEACFAFMSQFDNVLPLWGIQHMSELEQWLSFFNETPVLNKEILSVIEKDKKELSGDFCRGCGYCEPCAAGIEIHNMARMSKMIRRSPTAGLLSEETQAKMLKIDECIGCGVCMTRCPYKLKIPELLKKNLEDYKNILKNGF